VAAEIEFGASEAVRKPLVAIIFNIFSTMFYSRAVKNLALANMAVSDGVESVAQGGGAEPARPPINPSLQYPCNDDSSATANTQVLE